MICRLLQTFIVQCLPFRDLGSTFLSSQLFLARQGAVIEGDSGLCYVPFQNASVPQTLVNLFVVCTWASHHVHSMSSVCAPVVLTWARHYVDSVSSVCAPVILTWASHYVHSVSSVCAPVVLTWASHYVHSVSSFSYQSQLRVPGTFNSLFLSLMLPPSVLSNPP